MQAQLLVRQVEWFGEESATVTLDSGEATVEVFSHLGSYRQGDKVDNLLQILDGELVAAALADWPDDDAADELQNMGSYRYRGTGRVVDSERGLVAVQGFCIEFGQTYLTGRVEFTIDRLDLYPND
ncbi:hypothetical protein [Shewanella sp.]|uniref:hypothetical protein n=1 Tax=Shewanella sp. TaxID=50422 RepID=UPI003A96BA32